MYQPPQFKSTDPGLAAELMRKHPFAGLISTDGDGVPFVTHLPLHAEAWNYLAVHCTVRATLQHEPAAKELLLKKLIADHEPAYADQWRSLGSEFAERMDRLGLGA